ncbi:MAG: malate dehydrogenase [Gammaproteobacteria bacterium]|nr:MAG: malate dehydrogenase [Gammaproteobacteria bacterium]
MKPIKVLITGAAGRVGMPLVYRVSAGDLFGLQQPVELQLLEIESMLPNLEGEVMELRDCAFPLLKDVTITSDLETAFGDIDVAFMVGASPRKKGMERKDLLEANGKIFPAQGKALNDFADKDVKVIMVGNPANTNALIVSKNAPDISPKQITSMSRLDHNRALSMLAQKTNAYVSDIKRVAIWGNHSPTQYPDLSHAIVHGKRALDLVGDDWYRDTFITGVQNRGTEILKHLGVSSSISAAICTIKHFKSWHYGTNNGDWVSKGVYSMDNPYGIDEELFFSFPVICDEFGISIVENLKIDDFSMQMIKATEKELIAERDVVKHLL